MRIVSDDERRARLAVRHALVPGFQAGSPEEATRAVTVLHATETASVHLSCWARVPGVTVADVDSALIDGRTLVKQLAMRRTLFVFPRDLLPAVWPSASARVARTEAARIAKDVVLSGLTDDGDRWLADAREAVLDLLADAPGGLSATEIRQAIPMLDIRLSGVNGGLAPVSRVLTQLGATADIVRGATTGRFPTARALWTRMEHWLPEHAETVRGTGTGTGAGTRSQAETSSSGYRELVARMLRSFGPATEADIVWWFGATKAIVRTALAELDAVAVEFERGETGYLLPDDLDPVEDPGPWVALLPVLDPTIMGWQGRDFYLGPHKERLFDTRGNAGTTAWVNGRAVGCWVQDAAGVVHVSLVESVPASARRALDAEAERLTAWLGGVRIGTVYSSPAMKEALASSS